MRKTIIAGSMTSFYSTTIIKDMEIVTENPIQNFITTRIWSLK